MRPRVWLLNLDGDDELAQPAVPRDPFAAIEARPHLIGALAELTGGDDIVVRGGRVSAGAVGRAFCPTPRALEALGRAGAVPAASPALEVLRRVADRRFALGLGEGHVPGATVIEALDALRAQVDPTRPRVLKRLFAYAGRGRRLVSGGPVTAPEEAFAARALAQDGAFVLEPWLDRTLDLGVHGHVDVRGVVTRGRPTIQETTAAGAWRATRPAAPGELTPHEVDALATETVRAGAALHRAGYFGPFGVDAFRHRDRNGAAQLVSRCEVNARYTMGWAIGMGRSRPDLADDASAGGSGSAPFRSAP